MIYVPCRWWFIGRKASVCSSSIYTCICRPCNVPRLNFFTREIVSSYISGWTIAVLLLSSITHVLIFWCFRQLVHRKVYYCFVSSFVWSQLQLFLWNSKGKIVQAAGVFISEFIFKRTMSITRYDIIHYHNARLLIPKFPRVRSSRKLNPLYLVAPLLLLSPLHFLP